MLAEITLLAKARTAAGRLRKLGQAVLAQADNATVVVAAVVAALGVLGYLGIRLAA